MNYTWKLGPQRVRDPSKVTVELLADDMAAAWPLLVRYRDAGDNTCWDIIRLMADGRSYSDKDSPWDLMPPLMTREEALKECVEKYRMSQGNAIDSMSEVIDHWKLGPAKTRGAPASMPHIYAVIDGRPLGTYLWAEGDIRAFLWQADGRVFRGLNLAGDLMPPPKLTRKEVSQECLLHLDDPINDGNASLYA